MRVRSARRGGMLVGMMLGVAVLTLEACGDCSTKKLRPIGSTCDASTECESGLCLVGQCLDPEADSDADGLVNRLEASLGTNPTEADSDGDGSSDRDELDASLALVDTDGDGTADALESTVADADLDCIADQYDREDRVPNGDLSPLVPVVCPSLGVCGAPGAILAVTCKGTAASAACTFGSVPGYEATEATCDAKDNDCDGQIDEGLDCDTPPVVGSQANPGHDCLDVKTRGGATADGAYWIDPDLAGPEQPFQAACNMTLDGGGWTLVWVYGVTAPQAFAAPTNAVTPSPSWVVRGGGARAPVSTTAPTAPTTLGALAFERWAGLGAEVLVTSNLTDSVACTPGQGSLVDGVAGDIACRIIEEKNPACDEVAPSRLAWLDDGPALVANGLWLHFDGSTERGFPVHDPCGDGAANQLASDAPLGQLWLRPTPIARRLPAGCADIDPSQQVDGRFMVDLDGEGPREPFTTECLFSVERGGWTRLGADVAQAIADGVAGPGALFEYLYRDGSAFYRSPVTPAAWDWTSFQSGLGRWVYERDDGVGGQWACEAEAEPLPADAAWGVGCTPLVDLPPDARVLPGKGESDKDEVSGATRICQLAPDAFAVGGDGCTSGIEVWARSASCLPDEGSLFGDGSLSARDSDETHQTQCWGLWGPSDAFTFDPTDAPPDGSAPSLVVTNPELGNPIYAVQLAQEHLTFIAGHAYRFSYWAKADAARTLRIFFQTADLTHAFFWEDVPVPTTWQRYEVTFVADQTSYDVMFTFQLGEVSVAPVHLDSLRLVDLGPGACAATPGDLVRDGAFDSGRACWSFRYDALRATAAAMPSADAPEIPGPPSLELSHAPGSEDRGVAVLEQGGLSLIAGHTYALSFDARASAARELVALVQEPGQPPAGDVFVNVDTSWQHYESFFAVEAAAAAARVTFLIGDPSGAKLWLDNVSLVDLGTDVCASDAGGVIRDGAFDAPARACWEVFNSPTVRTLVSQDDDNVPPGGSGPSLRIDHDLPTGVPADVGIIQRDLVLAASSRYRLSFWVRASGPLMVGYGLGGNVVGFVGGFVPETTTWKRESFEFETTTATTDGSLQFQTGNTARTTVWLDDVVVERLGAVGTVDAPTAGLVAYFPFDGAPDDVVGGGTAVNTGAVLTADAHGVAGQAYLFDGTASRLEVSGATLPIGDAARTLTFWLRPDGVGPGCGSTGSSVVVWGTGDCVSKMYGAGFCDEGPYFWGGCSDYWPSSSEPLYHTIGAGSWSFMALRFDGVTLTVAVDGVLQPVARTLATQASKLYIGAETTDDGQSFRSWFKGAVDEVRIYDRALDDAELERVRASFAP